MLHSLKSRVMGKLRSSPLFNSLTTPIRASGKAAPFLIAWNRMVLLDLAPFLLALACHSASAAPDAWKPLVDKTQARFESIAAAQGGVMGLVVEDLAGEFRFAVNADRQFPQASAIKIPILMELLKQDHEGKLKLADRAWIEKANRIPGGVLGELGDHTVEMSLEDLAVLMILVSDNTATNILIERVGMANVTATMQSLGCPRTMLRRVMLDTAASQRGEENVSTPAEAARLMRLLAEGKFINRATSDHALTILRKPKPGAVNAALPKEISVAFKPGGIPGVATEWALVELSGRPYIVTAMIHFGLKEGDQCAGCQQSIREVSQVAYEFFSRTAGTTPYGVYVEPTK